MRHNRSVNADAQIRLATAPRLSMVAGYVLAPLRGSPDSSNVSTHDNEMFLQRNLKSYVCLHVFEKTRPTTSRRQSLFVRLERRHRVLPLQACSQTLLHV